MSIELATNKIEEYANSKTVQRGVTTLVLQLSNLPIPHPPTTPREEIFEN
jgi:hypothetical protein